jgi:hypothetical protein
VVARRDEVVAAVRAAGFRFVALDLEGFRSGSLNRGLDLDLDLDPDPDPNPGLGLGPGEPGTGDTRRGAS